MVGLALLMLILKGCGTYPNGMSADKELDRRVDSVLELMSVEEKLGQLSLLTSDWDVTGPTMRKEYMEDIRSGKCGNIFNAHTVAYNREPGLPPCRFQAEEAYPDAQVRMCRPVPVL